MNDEAEAAIEIRGLPSFLTDPRGLMRRRWVSMLLAFCTSFGAMFGGIWFFMRPEYTAVARVRVAIQRVAGDFVRSVVDEHAFEEIDASAGEVLSRAPLAQLIERYNLYPDLRRDLPIASVVEIMQQHIRIEPARTMGPQTYEETARVFTVAFTSASPTSAAAVANELATELVEASLRRRRQQAELTMKLLQGEMLEARSKYLADEERLLQFEAEHRRNPSSVDMSKRLHEAERKLSAALSSFTDKHPEVISLRREVATLERQLESAGGKPPAQASEHPEEFAALKRRARLSQENYQRLVEKTRAAELGQSLDSAQESERASILDRAAVPVQPERSRVKFSAAAGVGALGLALMLGVLLEARDPVLTSSAQVEELFGATVIGSLHELDWRKRGS